MGFGAASAGIRDPVPGENGELKFAAARSSVHHDVSLAAR
jgi:hypothetical protein